MSICKGLSDDYAAIAGGKQWGDWLFWAYNTINIQNKMSDLPKDWTTELIFSFSTMPTQAWWKHGTSCTAHPYKWVHAITSPHTSALSRH